MQRSGSRIVREWLPLVFLASILALTGCNCGEGTLGNCPAERCDNIDNDCDGQTDELELWEAKGESCSVGVGACASGGVFICNPDDRLGPLTCSGTPGQAGVEVCNGLDDDCDGLTDEEPEWSNLNQLCTVTMGGCVANGIFVCDQLNPTGLTLCSATPGPPVVEVCDGFDNDCDGDTDEEAIWADLGEQCTTGVGSCERAGIRGCDPGDPTGATICLAVGGSEGVEVCNGVDDDCDGETDEDLAWADKGQPCVLGIGACEAPGIRICDPGNAAGPTICNAIPGSGVAEVCNGLDDDCDGQTDNGALWAGKFGPCTVGVGACTAAGLMVCDPADPTGALVCNAVAGSPSAEACNGLDDDCDGQADEDALWLTLGDICNVGIGQCRATGVEICDVGNPGGATICSVSSGAAGSEICNGLDDDCDGQTDEEATWSDLGTVCTVGVGVCERTGVRRCDGTDPAGATICDATAAPAGVEVCNGLDDDCDGQTDEDATWADLGTVCSVGEGTCERSGVRICDPGAPAGPTICNASPGSTGAEVCDGLDNDCDGQTDEDAPWANKGQVCNVGAGGCQESGTFICDPTAPADPTICSANPAPPGTEICDGLDNDCDGQTDEDLLWVDLGTICRVGQGVCEAVGIKVCDPGAPLGATICSATAGAPGTETCNGLDDDCNGSIDDGPAWADRGQGCTEGVGVCASAGVRICDGANPAGPTVCSATAGAPGTETCNGLDDDCNGSIDDGALWGDRGTGCTAGTGICSAAGVKVCDPTDPSGATVCSATPGAPGSEVCNGLDDDCDGAIDDGALWSDLGTGCTSGQGVCATAGVKVCDPGNAAGATVCSASAGAPEVEVCNGVDDDCNGSIDDGALWANKGQSCKVGEGVCVEFGARICDPANPAGATICSGTPGTPGTEICNGLDDDCDGSIDEGALWANLGDGCSVGTGVCVEYGSRICDPANAAGATICSATPGAAGLEICNGLDDDCDGSIDEGVLWADRGQGCTAGTGICAAAGVKICDAADPTGATVCSAAPGPGGVEVCNGLDDDCDGVIDDGALWADKGTGCTSGVGVCAEAGSRICDAANPSGPTICSATPGTPGTEVCNGLDDDCDGAIDDGALWADRGTGCTVGVGTCSAAGVKVCDPGNAAGATVCSATPGAPGSEVCNGLDDDCDGAIDDGATWADLGQGCTVGVGTCSAAGVKVCDPGNAAGATVCSATPGAPGTETCNGLDDDCDGAIDDGALWADLGSGCTSGQGVCAQAGSRICDPGNAAGPTICSATPGAPGTEVCNGLDDDCDGTIDDGALWADLGTGCTSGQGICAAAGVKVCDPGAPAGATVCSATAGAPGTEVCNGLDDDCDGVIDDGPLWADKGTGCTSGVGVCLESGAKVCDAGNPAGPTVCSAIAGTPGTEVCNGLDDDCDGAIDDGALWATLGDGCTVGTGVCSEAGSLICDAGNPAGPPVCSATPGAPGTEVCNGLDDDCDGSIDEGALWADRGTGCTSGAGVCSAAGVKVCDPGAPAGATICSATPGAPQTEVCNGLDDDCDGSIDEGALWADRGEGCTSGLGICAAAGVKVCDPGAPAGATVCSATPGAPQTEVCNGRDDDCDGAIDDGALWVDLGEGCSAGTGECIEFGSKICDPGDPAGATICSATPGAPGVEVCNGLDDDCDGSLDEGALWADLGDGCNVGTGLCLEYGSKICDPGDPAAATICSATPGAPGVEVCNGRDDDCDGSIDEGVLWADLGEGCTAGTGVCSAAGVKVCDPGAPAGATVCSATPGAPGTEVCNGLDDDCNGTIDDGALWADKGEGCAVGTGVCLEYGSRICDPGNAAGPTICSATPGAPGTEVCNGLDDDCDGTIDDGALWADKGTGCTAGTGICAAAGVKVCDPGNAAGATVCSATPGAPGTEVCNGVDDDCDGSIDEGASWADLGQGCSAGTGVCVEYGSRICDPGNAAGPTICSATPGAPGTEVCNGLDDDCDGTIDDGALWADKGTGCTAGTGICAAAGVKVCDPGNAAGATVCSATPGAPGTEVCNGLDDDCDGGIDEGASWADLGQGCSAGTGICVAYGSKVCDPGDPAAPTVCSATPGAPGTEICNGLDDDCDGTIDDGALWADRGTGCTAGTGICAAAGVKVCDPGNAAGATVCSATPGPSGTEVCNGLDDDCDGSIDEGATWADLGQGCSAGAGICLEYGSRICDPGNAAGPTICSATPGAPGTEVCNGLDDDCDGTIDDGALWADRGTGCTAGAGICAAAGVKVCDAGDPAGATVCSATPGPAGTEVCNGLDDDCDGTIDDGALWADKGTGCTAGLGICEAAGVKVCDPGAPAGATICSATPGPSSTEVCNGLDDDCDGAIDDGALWADKGTGCTSGVGVCSEAGVKICNAGDPGGVTICSAVPGAPGTEVCNGLDDDCDGTIDDGALWADRGTGCTSGVGICEAAGVKVCDAGDPTGATVCSATPGAAGTEVCNGLDDDCDGSIDDGPLWTDKGQSCISGVGICAAAGVKICDTGAPAGATVCSATPGSPGTETCNGLDDDCDGTPDDNLSAASCANQNGVCSGSTQLCGGTAGWLPCDAGSYGADYETNEYSCDALDNDCDGSTDESLVGASCPLQQGVCAGVRQACSGGTWQACDYGPAYQAAEATCDGLDNDCDGAVDESLTGALCPLQEGVCAGARQVCAGASGWLACNAGSYGADYEVSEISCDGLDNDCDGVTDDVDLDGDGHVDFACGGDDCEDLNPLVFTGAEELCGDGIDNDCNFIAEDRDEDGDLHIDVACATYGGALPIDDCNDASALANPDETETCGDGLDNDCNGSIDDVDLDGDKRIDVACGGVDCDDSDAAVHPGAVELCDGKDNECNGVIDDKDRDVDGHVDVACVLYTGGLPVDDCDDANVGVNPDMDEVCGNALDEDCSGATNDKDVDGDGAVDTDPLCGGLDCDDDDPMTYPGAPEVLDGRNNDCDADGRADEGLVAAGQVIVTEIFYDSSQTPDENYEWFEVFNPGDRPVNLRQWLLRDQPGISQEIAVISADVIVPPRGFATLCRTGDPLYNGGVTCDYEYGYMQLANSADELILEFEGVLVDEIWYGGAGWPSATTGSLNLDPDQYFADNNTSGPWCNHPAGPPELANGDDCSPGISNISCTLPIDDPQVVAVHPDKGIEGGGTEVIIVGSGFSGATDVQVDGSSCSAWVVDSDDQITCTVPPGTAGTVNVTIVEGATSDTLSAGFTYTREASSNPETVNAISIDRPATLDVIRDRWCEGIFGLVEEGGTTGGGCPAGREYAPGALIAEVGYGTLSTDPRTDGSWIWFPSFCAQSIGSADEFVGTLKVSTPGTYSYGFRVSVDGGDTWNYGDLDGSGNGFSAAQLGVMLVR
ncbi:MAG: MopE-related protein [Deltaproteobacteria bacterium]|nr:MopE-related protein [Deltaproteobacteria bacterium]